MAAVLPNVERAARPAEPAAVSRIDDFVGAVSFDRQETPGPAVEAMSRECERFGGVATGSIQGAGWALRRFACDAEWMSAQPIISMDGRHALVWFGEIYNDRGASQGASSSAGEWILDTYRRDGVEALTRLDGIFAGAIVDAERRQVVLFGDRFATRALFYLPIHGGVAISTRVLPLCRVPGFRPVINRAALARRLRSDFLIGDDTLIEGIQQLPPGAILTMTDREVGRRTYWTCRYEPGIDVSDMDAAADAFWNSFGAAIRRQVGVAAKPFGLTLSGGLDSRLIAGLLAQQKHSFASASYGLNRCREIEIAGQLAAAVGAGHRAYVVDPQQLLEQLDRGLFVSDGMLDLRHFHGQSVADRLRPYMKTVFDGQAGDHFTGYLLTSILSKLSNGDEEAFHRAAYLINFDGHDRAGTEMLPGIADASLADFYREVPRVHRQELNACRQERYGDWFDAFNLRQRQRRYIANGVNNFRWQLPVLTPFFDYGFVDFALTIPEALRRGRRLYLHLFNRHLPALTKIPWTATGRPLVEGVRTPSRLTRWSNTVHGAVRRRLHLRFLKPVRHGYVDYDNWMANVPSWRAALRESLVGAESRIAPLFTPSYLAQMHDDFCRHIRHVASITAMMSVERYLRLVHR